MKDKLNESLKEHSVKTVQDVFNIIQINYKEFGSICINKFSYNIDEGSVIIELLAPVPGDEPFEDLVIIKANLKPQHWTELEKINNIEIDNIAEIEYRQI